MTDRSSRLDVRNPVLALPSAARLRALPAECRGPLAALLMDLSADAARRSVHAWRTHKAPMAVYWKAVGVYAKHIARAVRP